MELGFISRLVTCQANALSPWVTSLATPVLEHRYTVGMRKITSLKDALALSFTDCDLGQVKCMRKWISGSACFQGHEKCGWKHSSGDDASVGHLFHKCFLTASSFLSTRDTGRDHAQYLYCRTEKHNSGSRLMSWELAGGKREPWVGGAKKEAPISLSLSRTTFPGGNVWSDAWKLEANWRV